MDAEPGTAKGAVSWSVKSRADLATRTDGAAAEIRRHVPAKSQFRAGVGIDRHISDPTSHVRDEIVAEAAAEFRVQQSPLAFTDDFQGGLSDWLDFYRNGPLKR